MRTKITLACTECKNRNYNTTKDKKAHPDRMEIKKYCRFCKTHTVHKQSLARQTGAVVAVSVVLGLIIALLDFLIQYGVDFLVGLSF